MKIESICLKSDELELVGELFIPLVNEPCSALCICHGIPATPYNPEDKGYSVLAQMFCAAGFVTLIFNFRGAGRSQGNFDILGWSRDLQVAINFLYHHRATDKARLCLLGFSGGAAVSVYATAHNPCISSLVTCACPADFNLFTNAEKLVHTIQHFREIGAIRDNDFPHSKKEWLNGFKTISPIQWIGMVSPRPLLVIHGDADETVPVEHAYQLYREAQEPKEITILPGARHRLRLEEKAMTTALDWLKTRCRKT